MTVEHCLQLVAQGDEAYKSKDYSEAQRLYEKALEIAKDGNEETNYIYSYLTKVYKKNGRFREAYLLSKEAIPTPAAFRDCAICLRQIAKSARKGGDEGGYRQALEDLYRLAIYACLCYGKNGISGADYDKAVIISKILEDEQITATYEQNGKIGIWSSLLTEKDYKLFAEAFGQTEKTFDPNVEFRTLLEKANAEIKRQQDIFEQSLTELERRIILGHK